MKNDSIEPAIESDEDPLAAFTEEDIKNFLRFAATLRSIVKRLLAEGYKIEEGKVVPPKAKQATSLNPVAVHDNVEGLKA